MTVEVVKLRGASVHIRLERDFGCLLHGITFSCIHRVLFTGAIVCALVLLAWLCTVTVVTYLLDVPPVVPFPFFFLVFFGSFVMNAAKGSKSSRRRAKKSGEIAYGA